MILSTKKMYTIVLWLYIVVSGLHVIQNKLPGASTYILVGLSIVFALYVLLPKRQVPYSRSVSSYRQSILICFVIMCFSGLLNFLFGVEGYEWGYVLIDSIAMMIFYIGANYVDEETDISFEKLIYFLGGVACVIGLYAMLLSNFQITAVNERATNTLQLQYYLWKLMECWPFLLIHVVIRFEEAKKRPIRIVITIILILEYVILSLLFMKRMVFFDLLTFFVVCLISYRENVPKLLKRFIIIGLFLLVLYYIAIRVFSFDVSTIFQLTLDRFDTGESVSQFDRVTEFSDLFTEIGPRFLIAGMGIGSSHARAGGVNLHMGLLNFLFKGGIPLFIVIIVQMMKSLKVLVSRIPTTEKYYAACVTYTFIRSIISPFWVPNPTRILFSIALAMSLYKYDEIRRKY